MKTLVFNGSPRMKGETMELVNAFCEEMKGEEIKVVHAYQADIRPCVDCRWCFKNRGCAIKDGMQEIYRYLEECDHILIASPVYFEELTGVLLALLSRLQTYFSAKYIRREEPLPQKKTGGILLCAGSIGPREKAESTAAMILKLLNCENLGTVYAGKTDRIPVKEQPDILIQVKDLAKKMKNSYWSHGDQ